MPGKHMLVSPNHDRLDVLDGLRGCAISLVVWYHVWLVSGQRVVGVNFIAEAGYLGVDLFFFISGFCLYYPYARAHIEARTPPSTRRFFERRARKIVPSYVIALAVFAIVYHAQFASPQDALRQVVMHATFLHPLTQDTFGSISGPLWTIGVEVEFYLLFPLVIAAGFTRAPLVGYLLLAAVAELYRWTIGALGDGTSFWCINQLPAVIDIFGAGMLAAHAFVFLRRRPNGVDASRATVISLTTLLLGVVGLGVVSLLGTATQPDVAHDWINAHRILVGPLCFVLAVSTFFAAPALQAIVAARALVFLSTISYNLYLWHLEIIVWVHNAGLPPGWTFVLSLVLAVGVAAAMTHFVERPMLAFDFGHLWRSLTARAVTLRAAVRISRAS